MGDLLGDEGTQPRSLFTPDFGQSPHLVVGRDELTGTLRVGLGAGPGDHRFTSLLLGPRGSGKTVLLNAMAAVAREAGWIVLPLDAATSGIGTRINEYIAWAHDTHASAPDIAAAQAATTQRRSAAFRLFAFEWQREVVRDMRPEWGLRRQLTTLAASAAQRNSAVLLAVDEVHSGERDELRRLAADLQHITKAEGLPLAFLGAGLSEMKHTLLEDKKMTFFQRCHRLDMPALTPADATRFLAKTVRDAGGEFEGQALASLADASGTLPFRMQLLGHNAWHIADAPFRPIGDSDAASAVQLAERVMHEQVAVPTWHTLNATEQRVLAAIAEFEGAAHPHQIAERVAADPSTLARAERHLANAGCLRVGATSVELAEVIPLSSLRLLADDARRYTRGRSDSTAGQASPALTAPRCNAPMPRAQARCVLRRGHAGRHRSR